MDPPKPPLRYDDWIKPDWKATPTPKTPMTDLDDLSDIEDDPVDQFIDRAMSGAATMIDTLSKTPLAATTTTMIDTLSEKIATDLLDFKDDPVDQLSTGIGKSKISTATGHNLILGDCLEKMNELEPRSIDCIISDPPYGSTTNIWDKELDLEKRWEIIFVIFQ